MIGLPYKVGGAAILIGLVFAVGWCVGRPDNDDTPKDPLTDQDVRRPIADPSPGVRERIVLREVPVVREGTASDDESERERDEFVEAAEDTTAGAVRLPRFEGEFDSGQLKLRAVDSEGAWRRADFDECNESYCKFGTRDSTFFARGKRFQFPSLKDIATCAAMTGAGAAVGHFKYDEPAIGAAVGAGSCVILKVAF